MLLNIIWDVNMELSNSNIKDRKLKISFFEKIGVKYGDTKSRFEYPLKKFYFKFIFYIFISVISLFMLVPLAYYLYSKDKYKEFYIDNKRVIFKGKLRDAYISFVPWFILSSLVFLVVIQLRLTAIYYWISTNPNIIFVYETTLISVLPNIILFFAIFTRLYKWSISNLYFLEKQEETFYIRNIIQTMIVAGSIKAINYLSVGILYPISLCIKSWDRIGRTVISGNKLEFNVSIKEAYLWFLGRLFMIIISLGLYFPVYMYKKEKWITKNTHIDGDINEIRKNK